MQQTITHNHPQYRRKWRRAGDNKYNGAYFYSQEICKYFIPTVKTTRSWITINIPGAATDHAIVFIHNNLNPEKYDWLKEYKDLVLVCGIPETVPKVAHLGKAIYLPLSIDIEEVQKYRRPKTKKAVYVGRPTKRKNAKFPEPVDFIEGMPRQKLLETIAEYETVYAVGRCALEAKALDATIGIYDPRFPEDRWKLLDSKEAAIILQEELDKIDNPGGRKSP